VPGPIEAVEHGALGAFDIERQEVDLRNPSSPRIDDSVRAGARQVPRLIFCTSSLRRIQASWSAGRRAPSTSDIRPTWCSSTSPPGWSHDTQAAFGTREASFATSTA